MSFVLIFKGVSIAPPVALAAWQALVGALVAAGLGVSTLGLTAFGESVWDARTELGLSPIFALFGFFLLQVIRRYTEGQSGANILFILSLAPVVVLAVTVGLAVKSSLGGRGEEDICVAPMLVSAAGVAVAILGLVGMLANWERPSSFSPFAFFPLEELMLLGGVACWAVFLFLVAGRMRELDNLATTAFVLGGSGLMLLVTAVVDEGASSLILTDGPLRLAVVLGALGAALGCYSWIALTKEDATPVQISSAVLVAPVLASLLIFIDQEQGLTGPNPMIGDPVVIGSLLALLGAAVVWTSGWWSRKPREENESVGERKVASSPAVRVVLFGAAGTGVAGALAGLLLPVRFSSIEGTMPDNTPFAARWTTQGYEAAGAWLALVAAGLVVAIVYRAARDELGWGELFMGVGVTAALLVAAPHLSDSVFVAWRSWIPADIQHQLGTEYVNLVQKRLASPAFAAVDVACSVTLALTIVKILWKQHKAS